MTIRVEKQATGRCDLAYGLATPPDRRHRGALPAAAARRPRARAGRRSAPRALATPAGRVRPHNVRGYVATYVIPALEKSENLN